MNGWMNEWMMKQLLSIFLSEEEPLWFLDMEEAV